MPTTTVSECSDVTAGDEDDEPCAVDPVADEADGSSIPEEGRGAVPLSGRPTAQREDQTPPQLGPGLFPSEADEDPLDPLWDVQASPALAPLTAPEEVPAAEPADGGAL